MSPGAQKPLRVMSRHLRLKKVFLWKHIVWNTWLKELRYLQAIRCIAHVLVGHWHDNTGLIH